MRERERDRQTESETESEVEREDTHTEWGREMKSDISYYDASLTKSWEHYH